ncbi:MAG TPA: ABC transporter permease [Pyrinomonadaceae bacterium]|jgi:lipoprotein-releasing system permease protein
MPYEIFLALRYLRRRRGRRGAAQLTALAAVAGIACGVAALVVALALANGFRDELRDKILRGTAHLTLMHAEGLPVERRRETVSRLRAIEGVVDAHATAYVGALLSAREGAAYAVLRGVDADSARVVSEIQSTLVEGATENLFRDAEPRPESQQKQSQQVEEDEGEDLLSLFASDEPPVEAIVGAELARRTGLARVGEEGWIVSGERTKEPPGFVPRARRIRVAGFFRSGLHDYDSSWIYVPLSFAEAMATVAPSEASVVSVEVADIYATASVAERVRRVVGEGWTIVDWREANRPLFAALELERRTVTLIIGLIMLVAALNITATLVLVVVERRANIAILGALGAQPRSITAVFIIEGAVIGLTGVVLGVGLGLAACFLGNYFELVSLPPDVYSLSVVPLRPQARDVLLTATSALAVCLLATIYPARAASRVRPAEALRYE